METEAKPEKEVAPPGLETPLAGAALEPPSAKARQQAILHILAACYPSPRTELDHSSPFQLLVATILSAQSTDKGVNLATPALFAAYPDARALAAAEPEDLYPLIGRLGLFRNKAKSLVMAARQLETLYAGQVPQTHEDLMALPGVGRKTANVVLSNAFGIPAIAVDTHVYRVSRRLGLASAESVDGVEQELMAVIPREDWSDAHHWLILHGRRVCMARGPACPRCELRALCPSASAQPDR